MIKEICLRKYDDVAEVFKIKGNIISLSKLALWIMKETGSSILYSFLF